MLLLGQNNHLLICVNNPTISFIISPGLIHHPINIHSNITTAKSNAFWFDIWHMYKLMFTQ